MTYVPTRVSYLVDQFLHCTVLIYWDSGFRTEWLIIDRAIDYYPSWKVAHYLFFKNGKRCWEAKQLISECGTDVYRWRYNINIIITHADWLTEWGTREYSRGKYHCTVDLLFDWFGISCMTTDNFCFYLQNRLIQTSQTGGQQYSELVFPGGTLRAHTLLISQRERERERVTLRAGVHTLFTRQREREREMWNMVI